VQRTNTVNDLRSVNPHMHTYIVEHVSSCIVKFYIGRRSRFNTCLSRAALPVT